jgi:aspartyl-tRNA(Asn)/glutamyl-tRNA(Gln) amidotransferase subunit B
VFHDPAERAAFLTTLRRLVRWLGISDGDMEKGQLRCDANVSIRRAGETTLGTKTELKNLNSIKGVEKGLTAEIARQTHEVESGGTIRQATLLYDADHDKLAVMRSKEHAHDYRYFPEPDLPVLTVDAAWLAAARERLPELPWVRAERLVTRYGLPEYDAGILCDARELADYHEAVASNADPKLASNWIMTEVLRVLKERDWTLATWANQVPAARLADLLARVASRELPGPPAKQVLAWMSDEPGDVAELLRRHDIRCRRRPMTAPLIRHDRGAPRPGGAVSRREDRDPRVPGGAGDEEERGQAVPQTVKELLEAELARRAPTR